MSKFGFGLKKSSVIDLDKTDLSLSQSVALKEPSFLHCISCGSCTASCSAGVFTDCNLRQIILLVKRGQLEEIKQPLSHCMLCGKCQWVCPKGVNTRNVLLMINKDTHARKI